MAADFDAALAELYQVPHSSFVEERKRLGSVLKAAGDKAGAAALAKRARPSISAWTVNQLWWHARDVFSELLSAAARLREGDLTATAPHREALAKLRVRAAAMLDDAGHGSTESTLRRIAQTLSAIAATGSWDPDAPGTLTADRDPPGFDAALLAPAVAGEGAEAAQRVVALTEESKRRAAEAIAAAHAARDLASSSPGGTLIPFPTPSPRAVTPEGASRTHGPSVTPENPRNTTRLQATPADDARTQRPQSLPTPDARIQAARAELAAKEREIEDLRTRLSDAKTAAAKLRSRLEALESELDES